MQIFITGKNIDLGDSFRTFVQQSLTDLVNKYFNRTLEGHVIFHKLDNKHDNRIQAEIRLHISKKVSINTQIEGMDIRAVYDQSLEKIESQLRRYKGRLQNHHQKDMGGEKASYYILENTEQPDHEEAQPAIIAEMPTEILTLSVSDAVMHMDLINAPMVIFYNTKHKGLSVVYKRLDGNIGWVDPIIAESQQEEHKRNLKKD
jgi:ribosomal subunit interface protein